MTINIGLVTSEALILGCDSIASSLHYYMDPWSYVDRDEHGAPVKDAQGKYVAKFDWGSFQNVVTDVWGGVTKMFEICNTGANVAATTAGMAKLNDRNIEGYAIEFSKLQAREGGCKTVKEVVDKFFAFMLDKFNQHYAARGEVPAELRDELDFLIGGYDGTADQFPSLYRIKLKEQKAELAIPGGSQFGVAWAGQADGVERLMFGYDQYLRFRVDMAVQNEINKLYQQLSNEALRILNEALSALKAELPKEINTGLPPRPQPKLPWDESGLDIDFANLPLQDAVEFVSYLVNLQSGRCKFVRGVATVGGRTRVGMITRAHGLKMLNEPQIEHRNVGFSHDI